MKYLCPSLLSADFSKLKEEIKEVEKAGADILHCDIMDGNFVPNISFGPSIVKQVNAMTDLPLDVHLMINEPTKYIKDFADAGADYISVHYENNYHLNRVINQIKDAGVKAGVVLNPATSINVLEYILPYVDYVLLMSVNPGFGGQKFIPNVLDKVKALKNQITERGLNCKIEIDGGVDLGNIKELSDAGVDMFVCGNSVFGSKDRADVIKKMKDLIS
ncbi:MAG: ribulose-phosphate 3-epimerase [Ignavibacteria bacterium]|nr:ribulose-phosphate 3-epimerase [Ignavibacteria bacterium]